MAQTLILASDDDGRDLTTFLQRAQRLGCEHVRFAVQENLLIVTVAVLEKQGLLDEHPDVLGIKIFQLASSGHEVNAVFLVRAIVDRLAHNLIDIALPIAQPGIAWAGVAPPQTGWLHTGVVSESILEKVARSGIAEVAQANGLGQKIVTEVRREVWARPVPESSEQTIVVAGAGFAAFGLGFLTDSDGVASVSTNGNWTRLTTTRGHVLTR